MINWGVISAQMDAATFAHLSDDVAAPWVRQGVTIGLVSVVLEQVERPARPGQMSLIEMADVARFSVAQAAVVAPGVEPMAGDSLTVAGKLYVIHGQPWRDDKMDRRDWLCPVNG